MYPPTVITALPLETAIRQHLKTQDQAGLRSLLSTLRPPDLADVLDRLSASDRDMVFSQLSAQMAAGVLAEADKETKRSLLKSLSPARTTEILLHLPMDDTTRLLVAVPEQNKQLMSFMKPKAAQDIGKLLQYPASSAGRLMTEKFVRASADMTAGQTLEHLKKINKEVETFTDIYVVDSTDKLQGVVSLRELVLAPPEKSSANL